MTLVEVRDTAAADAAAVPSLAAAARPTSRVGRASAGTLVSVAPFDRAQVDAALDALLASLQARDYPAVEAFLATGADAELLALRAALAERSGRGPRSRWGRRAPRRTAPLPGEASPGASRHTTGEASA
ncbi:hypothetical protein GTR02_02485 [Kineococcus sp. R8]|uniref:hypothetical protein n=1 Tax=Kineococcus siccus TaxID=2696567 RepID=UPI0014121353|nr:hypothetical protein [Kineococcus siccus]NAZ80685.1 hypothetical protein [Kineococcus siccus]